MNGLALEGALTVRNVTMPVSLSIEQCAVTPRSFNAHASTRIDRNEFGVTAYRDWQHATSISQWRCGAYAADRGTAGPNNHRSIPEVGKCVAIYPRARGLTTRTVRPPALSPFTPSKGGACSATA